MQDRPVCFSCEEPIKTNAEMVFESLCGCDHHPSAVFHGICLFDWRDTRRSIEEQMQKMRAAWIAAHEGEETDG
jgi:hypothetical protein